MATIVLAEDDLHILRVVSIWLRRNQHTVFEAANGRQALDLVRRERPDLLITDVNMPQMDGTELVQACRAEGLPRVGSIVMSSSCDQDLIRQQVAGCNVVLHPKPFSPSRLIAEAERLLAAADGETQQQDQANAVTNRIG